MKEKPDWQKCWAELHQIRRQLHRVFERMRVLSPGNSTAAVNVERVAKLSIEFTADTLGLSVQQIRSRCRKTDVVWGRHMAIYATRTLTGASLSEVQRAFGLFNHMTIKYACARVREEPEARYRAQVNELVNRVSEALRLAPLEPASKRFSPQPLRPLP